MKRTSNSIADAGMAFVDSHTEGEPTRVVHAGLPALGDGPIHARATALARRYPGLYAAIVDEPRGHPALVGALMLPPSDARAEAAVVFVNNVGELPMCVHASIGVARTLVHLGRRPATPWTAPAVLETRAGEISVRLEQRERVAVVNVPSYRLHRDVALPTSRGLVRGDVAWGGNWFLIVEHPPVAVERGTLDELTALAHELRASIDAAGLRGHEGAAIDHIQLCGPSELADARNFVLCPGGAYDRSACGTGTSARMACLAADGRLEPGLRWRQEGITGSCFIGEVAALDGERVRPTIRGRAWITAEGRLLFDAGDPRAGLSPRGPFPYRTTQGPQSPEPGDPPCSFEA